MIPGDAMKRAALAHFYGCGTCDFCREAKGAAFPVAVPGNKLVGWLKKKKFTERVPVE